MGNQRSTLSNKVVFHTCFVHRLVVPCEQTSPVSSPFGSPAILPSASDDMSLDTTNSRNSRSPHSSTHSSPHELLYGQSQVLNLAREMHAACLDAARAVDEEMNRAEEALTTLLVDVLRPRPTGAGGHDEAARVSTAATDGV